MQVCRCDVVVYGFAATLFYAKIKITAYKYTNLQNQSSCTEGNRASKPNRLAHVPGRHRGARRRCLAASALGRHRASRRPSRDDHFDERLRVTAAANDMVFVNEVSGGAEVLEAAARLGLWSHAAVVGGPGSVSTR